jgi:ASCH domain
VAVLTKQNSMKAISVRQPWAWLIVNGHKMIETRSWMTDYRGPLIIHAAGKIDRSFSRRELEKHFRCVIPDDLPTGAVVGIADLIDCVKLPKKRNRFLMFTFGFKLANARKLERPIRCYGRSFLFDLSWATPADFR